MYFIDMMCPQENYLWPHTHSFQLFMSHCMEERFKSKLTWQSHQLTIKVVIGFNSFKFMAKISKNLSCDFLFLAFKSADILFFILPNSHNSHNFIPVSLLYSLFVHSEKWKQLHFKYFSWLATCFWNRKPWNTIKELGASWCSRSSSVAVPQGNVFGPWLTLLMYLGDVHFLFKECFLNAFTGEILVCVSDYL